MSELSELPARLARTRQSWHVVAARVLGAVRHAAEGHMGLVPTPGGFGTPPFSGDRQVRVDGIDLVDGDRRGRLTTLRDAAGFVGLDVDAALPAALAMPADPDAPLDVDADGAAVIAAWYALGHRQLGRLAAQAAADDEPSAAQLWPEHFDLAIELGPPGRRANYGASPGDGTLDEPYLYVGPHDRRSGPFWNAPFGAALTYSAVRRGEDPFAFLAEGRRQLRHG